MKNTEIFFTFDYKLNPVWLNIQLPSGEAFATNLNNKTLAEALKALADWCEKHE